MNRKGFSLVEIIIVFAVIATLLALSTINFNQWQRRQRISRQAREIYSDLMYIRQQAMVTGMTYRVQFASGSSIIFRSYSSEADPGREVLRKNLPYEIKKSNWISPSATEIEFNPRGIMVDTVPKSLCIYSDADPAVDSVVITQSRVNTGKIINQENKTCGRPNISIK